MSGHDAEIRRKIARGYNFSNIIFEDTRQGALYQNGQEVLRVSLGDPKELARCSTSTLAGIPPETFEYHLGNRSAFEWVIDLYQVTEGSLRFVRQDTHNTRRLSEKRKSALHRLLQKRTTTRLYSW